LVSAVLEGPAGIGAGVVMTPAVLRLLQDLRRQLFNPSSPEEGVVDQAVVPAAVAPGARVPQLFTISRTPPIVPRA
jgi:uncharacterized membrane protein YfcA